MKKLSEVFDVRYGHSLELNRLKKTDSANGIAFVSRKMGDNGISAYVRAVEGIEPARAGELSCALGGNGVLSTFIQDRPFYTGRDTAILIPKKTFSTSELLYYCVCIKHNRPKYSFGRQANRTLGELMLPDQSDFPKWVKRADTSLFEGANAPAKKGKMTLSPTSWKPFQLSALFSIRKGTRLTKATMKLGETPFVGAIDHNNGIAHRISREPNHDANTMTVVYNGSGVGEAFYQPGRFWASDDVNVLYPKFHLTPALGLFVATVLRREKYRFTYGRKWHKGRMEATTIRLPADVGGNPNWKYVERFILTLPFSSQLIMQKAE